MMRRWRPWLIAGGIFLGLIAAFQAFSRTDWYAGYERRYNTIWAQNATQKAFSEVRVGDPLLSVIAKLGYPIRTEPVPFEEGVLWGRTEVKLEPFTRATNLVLLADQPLWVYAIFDKEGASSYFRAKLAGGKTVGPLAEPLSRKQIAERQAEGMDVADSYRIETGKLLLFTERRRYQPKGTGEFLVRRVYVVKDRVVRVISLDQGPSGLSVGLRGEN